MLRVLLIYRIYMHKQCYLRLLFQTRRIFNSSAKKLLRLGSYHQCVEDQAMNYNLVFISQNDNPFPIFFGTCLPKQCDGHYIQKTVNTIIEFQKLPYHTKILTQSDIQNYDYPLSWVFWLLMPILVSILVLVLIATFSNKQSVNNSKVLKAFRLQQTLKMFKYNDKQSLNVLNGLKSLSMLWVIFGHTYGFLTQVQNLFTIQGQLQTYSMLFTQAGLFSVDVFFYIGGFLVAYSFLRQKSGGFFKYPLAIIHRLLRIWPCYIIAMCIFGQIFIHLGSGPLWSTQQTSISACKSMWKPLLFIDNLIPTTEYPCMGWGWYLQNDIQLFIFSIFLLAVYSYNKIFFYVSSWLLIVSSIVANFILCQIKGYHQLTRIDDISANGDYNDKIYNKPWMRCPPYLIGLILGVAYVHLHQYRQKKQIKQPFLEKARKILLKRYVRLIIEYLGFALMLFIIFIPRTNQVTGDWSQTLHSLYLSCGRNIFILGLTCVIVPYLIGIKSFVGYLLDNKAFSVIGKISYCTYLLHFMILQRYYSAITTDIYFRFQNYLSLFFSFSLCSLLAGFIMTIAIESPFSSIQRMLLGKLRPKIKESHKTQNSQIALVMKIEASQQKPVHKELENRFSLNESFLERDDPESVEQQKATAQINDN